MKQTTWYTSSYPPRGIILSYADYKTSAWLIPPFHNNEDVIILLSLCHPVYRWHATRGLQIRRGSKMTDCLGWPWRLLQRAQGRNQLQKILCPTNEVLGIRNSEYIRILLKETKKIRCIHLPIQERIHIIYVIELFIFYANT